ncbi:MAG: DUF805 domain-containing protein [Ferrimicrobium sp.]|jgi:uncharacterized membrane protein YhaH (DUF805 family)|uniref:DUF805 domain-containing protein n=1 Tax=Ferrimicrobium acidiphilum TaxID=121039 RepID=A0ABV3Y4C3_9ACTN|nr:MULTISPECIES: DUF805 domain-containing protein [Ferrimicrobium]MDA8401056.1 DUF805 domain-containing protein [Actinomycetota bacterium]
MGTDDEGTVQPEPAGGASWKGSGLPKFPESSEPSRGQEIPSITFGAAYLRMWKLFTNFRIRSTRGEYWKAYLVNVIIAIVLFTLFIAAHTAIFVVIYFLYDIAEIVPSLALTVRRLHDTDHSGAWILIALIPLVGTIILIVFLAQRSTPGTNRYGSEVQGFA